MEIVRDWKTGQSLQYGFIEFESEKSCEEAYLKMENVVIDDRRIHVDFSQSVTKLMPKMKNKQEKTRKSGENREKNKELVPKLKQDRVYHGDEYNFVVKDPSAREMHEARLREQLLAER